MIKMSYSLKTVGMDRYKANLANLSVAVGKAAGDIEARAKVSIELSSGRYKEYPGRKEHPHYSSPPGTPPNSDTGNLANSIGSRMTGRYSAEVSAGPKQGTATAAAKYAVPLELGWTAKSGGTVPARPFLRPAVEYVAPSFQAACKAILRGK